MKKISVIVPVYNMEKRLEICLKSLESQTLNDIEAILINDGSQDNSIKIIKKHMKQYPNLYKLIDRENKGISASRNEGIKISTGKYLAFVDSDDYIENDMLEKLYNAIIKEDSDIAICNYKKIYEDSDKVTYHNIAKQCKITSLYENPKMIYKIDYAPWNKLYKKDLWKNIEYPIGVKYEDLETILRVFLKANKITYIDDYLYDYFQNKNGETATINERIYEIFIILSHLKKEFINKPKKMWLAYQELCISKIFIYNQLILKKKDQKFSQEFINEGYQFIETNFNSWKIPYIMKSRGVKNFILRIIQTNRILYNKYIKFITK